MLASSELDRQSRISLRRAVIGCSACFLLASVFAGCGGSSTPQSVTGSVSYRGKAVFPGKVLLRSQSGKGLSANLNAGGEFRMFGVEKGETYSVAIEPIKLGGIGARARTDGAANAAESQTPLNREDTIPEKFRQANIAFPRKYSSFETSMLSIDCSKEVPSEKQVLELQ